jgi:hypothetical protein
MIASFNPHIKIKSINIKMIELIDLSKNKILVTRRSPEERSKNYLIATQKKIQQYIKDGSKGDLDLGGTPITSLPQGLRVEGDLDLEDTKITTLSQSLTVGGDLYLGNTKITSLPQGLTVGGNLDLGNTQITSLPQGLIVGGVLYLYGTKITFLPKDLTVGGNLYLRYTPLSKKYSEKQIRQMVPGVKGDIIMKTQ